MRNTLSILAAAAALPAVGLAQTAAAPAPVVINELSYNDSGTDDREFVELYNNTNAPIDLSNWTINSDDVNASTTTQTLPVGTIIPANGFLLIGDTALGNQDVVITIALENGPGEIVWLADANGSAVDSFAYDIASGTPGPPTCWRALATAASWSTSRAPATPAPAATPMVVTTTTTTSTST